MNVEYDVDDSLIPMILQEILRFMNQPNKVYTINGNPIQDLKIWDNRVTFLGVGRTYTLQLGSMCTNFSTNITFTPDKIQWRTNLSTHQLLDVALIAQDKNTIEEEKPVEEKEISWYRPLDTMMPGTVNVAVKRYGFSYRKLAEDLILYHLPYHMLETIVICDSESFVEEYDSFTHHHSNILIYGGKYIPRNEDEIDEFMDTLLSPKVIIMRTPPKGSLISNKSFEDYICEWKKIAVKRDIICIFVEQADRKLPAKDIGDARALYIGNPNIWDNIIIQEGMED